MVPDSLHFPVVTFLNHVLSDYPAARNRLRMHQGKVIAAQIGPVLSFLRLTRDGEMELVGSTGEGSASPTADVTLTMPLSILPGLLARKTAVLSQIDFTGDSELAAALSDIAGNVDWDVEADLSRIVGDIAARRIVASVQAANAWRKQAGQRLSDNMAEYLTEERQAFITAHQLDALARQNETLRDDIARLDARFARVKRKPASPSPAIDLL